MMSVTPSDQAKNLMRPKGFPSNPSSNLLFRLALLAIINDNFGSLGYRAIFPIDNSPSIAD